MTQLSGGNQVRLAHGETETGLWIFPIIDLFSHAKPVTGLHMFVLKDFPTNFQQMISEILNICFFFVVVFSCSLLFFLHLYDLLFLCVCVCLAGIRSWDTNLIDCNLDQELKLFVSRHSARFSAEVRGK